MARDEDKLFAGLHAKLEALDSFHKQFDVIKTSVRDQDDYEIAQLGQTWSSLGQSFPSSPLGSTGSPLKRSSSSGAFNPLKSAGASMVRTASGPQLRPVTSVQDLNMTLESFASFSSAPACAKKVFPYQFGSLMNESKVLTIKFHGHSGIEMDGALVYRAVMQAWRKGVRPGWRVNSVAGCTVNQDNEDDVQDLIRECEAHKGKYEIVFTKGRVKFGTGVVQASKLEIEKDDNVERLRKWFKYQGSIARVECRAISFSQLEKVFSYAEQHCHAWKDEAPPDVSPFAGKTLHIDFLNFHHVKAWITLPATEKRKSAFVEHLTKSKQVPAWCVSHYWSQPFADFMKCVKLHLATHNLSIEEDYWISAFAINHHEPQEEISNDKHETSFFKALNISQFHVLLVLDAEAKVFDRIWCLYEVSMCLGRSSTPVDIAVCRNSRAELLTHGLTAAEDLLEQRARDYATSGAGIEAKAAREATFPLFLAATGMEITLETARAGNAEDRAQILNCLVGQSVDSEPPAEHPLYAETNKKLHAFFAQHLMLRAATTLPADSDASRVLWVRLAQAMQSDVWRKSLDLNLEGFKTEGMPLLLQCFPPNVQEMMMRFRGSNITDPDLEDMVEAIAKLPVMGGGGGSGEETKRKISFDFRNCENTDETDIETFDPLKQIGIEIDLDITESEFAKADGDVTTKAIVSTLHMSLVRGGIQVKNLNYRVVPAVPELAKALANEGDSGKRKCAAKALGNLGQAAFDALPALRLASTDDLDESVKKAAAWAFAQVSGGTKD